MFHVVRFGPLNGHQGWLRPCSLGYVGQLPWQWHGDGWHGVPVIRQPPGLWHWGCTLKHRPSPPVPKHHCSFQGQLPLWCCKFTSTRHKTSFCLEALLLTANGCVLVCGGGWLVPCLVQTHRSTDTHMQHINRSTHTNTHSEVNKNPRHTFLKRQKTACSSCIGSRAIPYLNLLPTLYLGPLWQLTCLNVPSLEYRQSNWGVWIQHLT